MKLIFCLGNPGPEYASTRHNIGFLSADFLAREWGNSDPSNNASFATKAKFHAKIAEFTIDNEKVLLAKPQTFYNLVGESARAIMDFYKLASEDILVIHDDLALPFGTVRARTSVTDPAGNNGIKSLLQHIGADFNRLRIGTKNDVLAEHGSYAFVLEGFTAEERKTMPAVFNSIKLLTEEFIRGALEPHKVSI